MKVRLALAAGALAASALIAAPSALAGTVHASVVVPAGFSPASAVPWSSLGAGWTLTTWEQHYSRSAKHLVADLVLVSPAGARYVLATVTDTSLLSWSGDAARALLEVHAVNGPSTLEVMDLRTAAITSSFKVGQVSFESARFTRPYGLGIYASFQVEVNGHWLQQLKRYSFDGRVQTLYATSYPKVGDFTGAWLASPDGRTVVLGARHGLAVASNQGTSIGQLRVGGTTWCAPRGWWSPGVVLAWCGPAQPRLWLFPLAGGKAHPLTPVPRTPDVGDINAFSTGSGVFVQSLGGCGYTYVSRLAGTHLVPVKVPGVRAGNSAYISGATRDALTVESTPACQGGSTLLRYFVGPRTTQLLLGPPVTGGSVVDVVAFGSDV